MSFALAELERVLANLIRYGKIAQIDYSTKRVRVSVGELKTDWLPWKERRAGSVKTWSPPSIGEQVIILSPFGDMAQATILTGINSDSNDTPSSDQNVEKTVFSDGSSVEYNSQTNTMTISIEGAGKVITNCKEATVTANTSVLIDCPQSTFTGAVTVQGLLTYEDGLTGTGSASMSGNISIDGNVENTGTLTNNGVNVGSTHSHLGVKSGPDQSGPPVP